MTRIWKELGTKHVGDIRVLCWNDILLFYRHCIWGQALNLSKFTVANRRNEITKIFRTFSTYEIGIKIKEFVYKLTD